MATHIYFEDTRPCCDPNSFHTSPRLPKSNIRASMERPSSTRLEPRALSSLKVATMIDIKALEYAEPIDANLVCPICQCPFFLPVSLYCDHIFCSGCLEQSIRAKDQLISTCPTCRGPFSSTSTGTFQPAPRVINQIVENLRVKCPSVDKGCFEEVPRGTVQDHVVKYCPYTDVQCPDGDCGFPITRKNFAKGRCLHSQVACQDCSQPFPEWDLEDHRTNRCSFVTLTCPHCDSGFLKHQLERHVKACPQAVLSCEAAPYGCDFQAKALAMEDHSNTCPLAKLVPFLKAQNNRLETHAKALDALRAKHSSLETVLCCIRESLETFETRQRASEFEDSGPVTHTPEAYDATTHHLLCGQESLQRDVERMSTEISNLDRKATLMVLQESFETKDELARANAAINSMRAQVNWLTSANHQRGIPTRPLGAPGNAEASVVATDPHRPLGLQASGRPSSDARQEPKL